MEITVCGQRLVKFVEPATLEEKNNNNYEPHYNNILWIFATYVNEQIELFSV